MKRIKQLFPFVWYPTALVIIASTLSCTGYRFAEAFAIAVTFLPGILIARYATPQISFADKWQGWHNTIFLWAGILAVEYFLIMLANYYILKPVIFTRYDLPTLLTNPLFILFVVATFAITGLLIEREIEQREPYDDSIRFTSERRTITLDPANVLYIESNDTEVFVCTEEESFRTRIRIGQWETMLDRRFLRVHRSYIINMHRIEYFDGNRIKVAGTTIEVSRKYKDMVRAQLKVE
ncbi:MAG: LytTR family transcriptional regulator DNA-binding domain-containing protein [Alistipes sp.]|nr:LytTR family transcriptional regulator DNA-binding domain-containing protein [Alistipes sp.]